MTHHKDPGWGSSWYDAIFFTYLADEANLVPKIYRVLSSKRNSSCINRRFISFFSVKFVFNLIFIFYNCNATILMIIILLRCLLAFTISWWWAVTCMTSRWYRILLVFLWKSHIEKKIKHSVAQHEFICITSKAFQKLP